MPRWPPSSGTGRPSSRAPGLSAAPRSGPPWIKAARSEHWILRGSALRGRLRFSPWDAGVAALVLEIQAEAMHVLSAPEEETTPADRFAAEGARSGAASFLISLTPAMADVLPVFLDGLASEDGYTVGYSIAVLGKLGALSAEALPRLEAMLEVQKATYVFREPGDRVRVLSDPHFHGYALEKTIASIRGEKSPPVRWGR